MGSSFTLRPTARQADAIRRQLTAHGRGIQDERVIRAMTSIPRHFFVPEEFATEAYADGPLPIGCGQTISQPFVVAFMTQALNLKPSDRILEIGVGCGYQTAVLSRLAKEVYGIEIVRELAERATVALDRMGADNVSIRAGDGLEGWPEEAPFDAILVACAPNHIPQSLVDQLASGGRMILPVGERHECQNLWLLENRGGAIRRESILPVRFVPMTGRVEVG